MQRRQEANSDPAVSAFGRIMFMFIEIPPEREIRVFFGLTPEGVRYISGRSPKCEICGAGLLEVEWSRCLCSSCSKDYADSAAIIRNAAISASGAAKYRLWRAAHICDSPIINSEYLVNAENESALQKIIMQREAKRILPTKLTWRNKTLAAILRVLHINPMRIPTKVWQYAHPVAPARY